MEELANIVHPSRQYVLQLISVEVMPIGSMEELVLGIGTDGVHIPPKQPRGGTCSWHW